MKICDTGHCVIYARKYISDLMHLPSDYMFSSCHSKVFLLCNKRLKSNLKPKVLINVGFENPFSKYHFVLNVN